ncbi:tensin, partial [Plakobranchus ocellatus]
PRFPDNGKVEFVFGPSSDVLVSVSGFKSDVTVPVDDNEESLARSDSYENFNQAVDALTLSNRTNGSQARPVRVVTSQPSATSPTSPVAYSSSSRYQYQQQHQPQQQQRQQQQTPYYHPTSSSSNFREQPPAYSTVGPTVGAQSPGGGGVPGGYSGASEAGRSTGSVVEHEVAPDGSLYAVSRKLVSRSPSGSGNQQQGRQYPTSGPASPPVVVSPTTAAGPLMYQQQQPRHHQQYQQQQQPYYHHQQPHQQQQQPHLTNGSVTSNIDSGQNASYNSHYNSSSAAATSSININNNIQHQVNHQQQQQQQTRKTVQTLEEKTQLDELLNDLLSPIEQKRTAASPALSPNSSTANMLGTSNKTSTQRSDVIEHEVMRSPTYRSQQASPPPPARPSYRPAEFEIPPPSKYSDNYSSAPPTTSSAPMQYSSLDSDANAWLAAQQQKLKNFKEGRDASGRTVQEKNLVNELKFAQNKYYTRRTDLEEEERSVMDQYGRQHNYQQHLNGPLSPPQQYASSYSTSYVESSRSYGDSARRPTASNKPPPSPIMQRSLQPPAQNAAPPAPIPARGSSREFMQRTRSNSSSSWQQQQHRSTLTRQQSDTLYDRRDVEHIQPKSYGSTHSTPPLSPRAASPIGPTSTTTYTQYRTVHRDITDETRMAKKAAAPPVQAAPPPAPPPQQPPPTVNHHYITEVFVHRTDLKDKTDSSRLDELERTLERATNSMAQKAPPPQQQPVAEPKEVKEEEIVQQTKPNKVFQEAKPRTREIEEDRIMLRPIGPGMQTLEPESAHTGGTLGRPTTPGFPVSGPATPPFPVSPRTPYQNPVGSLSGSNLSLSSHHQQQPNLHIHHNHHQEHHHITSATPTQTPPYGQQGAVFQYHVTGTEAGRVSPFPLQPPPRAGLRAGRVVGSIDPGYISIPEDSVLSVGPQIVSPTSQMPVQQQQQQTVQYQQFHQVRVIIFFIIIIIIIIINITIIISIIFITITNIIFVCVAGVGPQIVSPTSQMPVQQQQQQTVQYQQFHQSQQYQTVHQSDGIPPGQQPMYPLQQQPQLQQQQQMQQLQQQQAYSQQHQQGNDTLHIDTSPKMLLSPRSPSAGSPPSPGNLNTLRQQLSSAHSMSSSVISPGGPHSMTGQSSPSVYFGLSRRGSLSSLADSDMVHTTPKFVKDTSKYWYKPNISREEAIQMLKDKMPGTFVIRDSNSFPGAFGLALKVATIPPNVQAKPSGDPQADLVRHFLIEPTPKGVRLRGCSNEPVFGSLAALVYQHSVTPLALPCKLALPEGDVLDGLMTPESPVGGTELNSAANLLAQGAACNVIFINSVDMESLTGPQAVAKAVKTTFENLAQGRTTMVHFKVSSQGITLTDNNRKLFFRRHYPVSAVTYCGMDPQDRRWKREIDAPGVQGDARLFGFVARKQGSSNENSCHIFAELDPEQPASAIVNFVTKVMIGQSKVKS